MLLGALLDLGASADALRQGLALLPIAHDFELQIERTDRSAIRGTACHVLLKDQPVENHLAHVDAHDHDEQHDHAEHDQHDLNGQGHDHEHHHDHAEHHHEHHHDHAEHHHNHEHHQAHGRSYADIIELLQASQLDPKVIQQAIAVFTEIGRAEAAVHGVELAQVHFHEVGAVDSIVDIVGVVILLDSLGVDRIVCSRISDGQGLIKCQHGYLPVPVPAVMKMLEGSGIPYQTGTADTELVTPTGFGLIKTLCHEFGTMPAMDVFKSGYGFGQREIGRLNAVRAVLGRVHTPLDIPAAAVVPRSDTPSGMLFSPAADEFDQIVQLSCQVDNVTGEQLGQAAGQFMSAGALDVMFTPVFMKKWRPAYRLDIFTLPAKEREMVALAFKMTGTIGLRRQLRDRHVMSRHFSTVETPFGPARIKTVQWQEISRSYPEQDDVVALSAQSGLSVQDTVDMIMTNLDNRATER